MAKKVKLGQALVSTIQNAERAYLHPNVLTGITTGLRDVDEQIGGLHKSDLIILAGRPAMGKTALVTNIAFNTAQAYKNEPDNNGGIVLYFSLDLSSQQVATRIISQQSEISPNRIRTGEIDEQKLNKLWDTCNELSEIELYIDDTPVITINTLKEKAEKAKQEHGLDLIVIDYLQLLTVKMGQGLNCRSEEITYIVRELKRMAKELDITIIVLSELPKIIENRQDKRPMLTDLRLLGDFEQYADIVMFVYRNEYYIGCEAPEQEKNEPDEKFMERIEYYENTIMEVRDTAELIIAKHRHALIGIIELYFNNELTKFSNIDEKN